jgi:FAD/FMN-containing dehydrogenase
MLNVRGPRAGREARGREARRKRAERTKVVFYSAASIGTSLVNGCSVSVMGMGRSRVSTVTWSNWAGNVRAEASEVQRPASVDDVCSIVRRATRCGKTVKAVGSGHSFSDIAASGEGGIIVDMTKMGNVLHADASRTRITVEAGMGVDVLCEELLKRGWSLPNIGVIKSQTVAGLLATCSHGSALASSPSSPPPSSSLSLAACVVGARIVIASGEILEVPEDGVSVQVAAGSAVRLLPRDAASSLGALGIIVSVTLQCESRFDVVLHETSAPHHVVTNQESLMAIARSAGAGPLPYARLESQTTNHSNPKP